MNDIIKTFIEQAQSGPLFLEEAHYKKDYVTWSYWMLPDGSVIEEAEGLEANRIFCWIIGGFYADDGWQRVGFSKVRRTLPLGEYKIGRGPLGLFVNK